MKKNPDEGIVFRLTMDGSYWLNKPKNMPYGGVRTRRESFLLYRPTRRHKIIGKTTRDFKLIEIGLCLDLRQAKKKLRLKGIIPNGIWLMAFKEQFPNRNAGIFVADDSWVYKGTVAN